MNFTVINTKTGAVDYVFATSVYNAKSYVARQTNANIKDLIAYQE